MSTGTVEPGHSHSIAFPKVADSGADRVVVMSAGPASHPMGEFVIDIARPRDVAEIKSTPRFRELHAGIWDVLREEVLKGYQQQLQKAA